MKLYVDDFRKCPEGWELARSISTAIRLLDTGYVEELDLDHDIKYPDDYPKDQQEDFTAVLKYAVLLPKNKLPKHFYCHSSNGWAYGKYDEILSLIGKKLEPILTEYDVDGL